MLLGTLAAEGGKDAKLQYAAEMVAGDSSASAVSTYDCPVCRRAQILDLDRLQVVCWCHSVPTAVM
jgi:hypothetical protein